MSCLIARSSRLVRILFRVWIPISGCACHGILTRDATQPSLARPWPVRPWRPASFHPRAPLPSLPFSHSILLRSNFLSSTSLSSPRGALGFGDGDRRIWIPEVSSPPLSLSLPLLPLPSPACTPFSPARGPLAPLRATPPFPPRARPWAPPWRGGAAPPRPHGVAAWPLPGSPARRAALPCLPGTARGPVPAPRPRRRSSLAPVARLPVPLVCGPSGAAPRHPCTWPPRPLRDRLPSAPCARPLGLCVRPRPTARGPCPRHRGPGVVPVRRVAPGPGSAAPRGLPSAFSRAQPQHVPTRAAPEHAAIKFQFN
jgi:hypothetical protein